MVLIKEHGVEHTDRITFSALIMSLANGYVETGSKMVQYEMLREQI